MVSKVHNYIYNQMFDEAATYIKQRGEKIVITDDDERPDVFNKGRIVLITSGKSAAQSFRQRGPDGKLKKVTHSYCRMALVT